MGHRTDARLADFARRTGIQPATGEWAGTLERIQKIAFDLIRIAELERSGVRDGDGFWHGSDPLFALIEDLAAINEARLSPYLRQQTADVVYSRDGSCLILNPDDSAPF